MTTITVTGSNGYPGQRGFDGSHSSHAHGQSGGNATAGTSAMNGGMINVELRVDTNGQVIVSGWQSNNLNPAQPFNFVLLKDSLFLNADGGGGGAGANGGNGGRGGDGTNGSDATRWSNGSNGTNGFSGGDAGAGSSGGNGGNGGQITITVTEETCYMLMKIKASVLGGRSGLRGSHGVVGSGGRGGSGGRSHHWTTERKEWHAGRNEHIMVSHSHSNPGGSDGHRGTNGNQSGYRPADGICGKAGIIVYNLIRSDGSVLSSDTPFDVKILSDKLSNSLDTDIHEFGDVFTLTSIVAKNKGGLPTPSHLFNALTVDVNTNSYLSVISNNTECGSIPAQQEVTMGGSIELQATDFITPSAMRAEQHLEIKLTPSIQTKTMTHIPFGHTHTRKLTLTHPIELSNSTFLPTLAQGQTGRLLIELKNISNRDLGEDLIDKHSGEDTYAKTSRKIIVLVESVNPNILILDDNNIPKNSFEYKLRGKSQIQDYIRISVSNSAPNFQKVQFKVKLMISHVRDHHLVVIQERTHDFQISSPYEGSSSARVLLMISDKTTAPEINTWRSFYTSIGMNTAVLNVSVDGIINFDDLSMFKGSSIVILDSDSISKLINFKEFMLKYAIGLSDKIIFADNLQTADFIKNMYLSTISDKIRSDVVVYNDKSDMYGEIKISRFTRSCYACSITNTYVFRTPTKDDIEAEAHTIAKLLRRKNPMRKFAIYVKFSLNQISTFNYNIGTVYVINLGTTDGIILTKNKTVDGSNSLQKKRFLSLLTFSVLLELVDLPINPLIFSEEDLATEIIFRIASEIKLYLDGHHHSYSISDELSRLYLLMHYYHIYKKNPDSYRRLNTIARNIELMVNTEEQRHWTFFPSDFKSKIGVLRKIINTFDSRLFSYQMEIDFTKFIESYTKNGIMTDMIVSNKDIHDGFIVDDQQLTIIDSKNITVGNQIELIKKKNLDDKNLLLVPPAYDPVAPLVSPYYSDMCPPANSAYASASDSKINNIFD